VKEVLFPKIHAAREQCREHRGASGMPSWTNPSLGSPRDPWMPSDPFGRVVNKSDNGSSNNQGPSHNQLLDSAEIKEDASGGEGQQGDPFYELSENPDLSQNIPFRGKPGSSSQVLDDHSSQGDNSQDQRVDEDEKLSAKDLPESSTDNEAHQQGSFGLLESREEGLEVRETAMEVRDVFHVRPA